MSWREERDALIAQTLAFVQSVTGKPTDFAQLPMSGAGMQAATPVALPAEPLGPAALVDAAAFQVMRAEAATIDAATRLASGHPQPAPASIEVDTGPDAAATEGVISDQTVFARTEASAPPAMDVFSGEHFTSITAELGLQRDMQSEIKARIASFRAHQERFNRERQEYVSATLARLRDSMNGSPQSKP